LVWHHESPCAHPGEGREDELTSRSHLSNPDSLYLMDNTNQHNSIAHRNAVLTQLNLQQKHAISGRCRFQGSSSHALQRMAKEYIEAVAALTKTLGLDKSQQDFHKSHSKTSRLWGWQTLQWLVMAYCTKCLHTIYNYMKKLKLKYQHVPCTLLFPFISYCHVFSVLTFFIFIGNNIIQVN